MLPWPSEINAVVPGINNKLERNHARRTRKIRNPLLHPIGQ
jgi:hypothetical protein